MQADPHHSSLRHCMLIGGIASGFMLAIVGTFVIVLERGLSPPTGIIDSPDLSQQQVDQLVNARVVGPDETILMFYSSGLVTLTESGTLLTDKRVICFVDDNQHNHVWSMSYDQIADVGIVEQGNASRPTIVALDSYDDGRQLIALSAQHNLDRSFVDEIRRRLPAEPTASLVDRDSSGE